MSEVFSENVLAKVLQVAQRSLHHEVWYPGLEGKG